MGDTIDMKIVINLLQSHFETDIFLQITYEPTNFYKLFPLKRPNSGSLDPFYVHKGCLQKKKTVKFETLAQIA